MQRREMPVAPQKQTHHHLSLLSSFRHVLQPFSRHHPSAVAPDPPTPSPHPLFSSSSPSSLSSSSHDPQHLQLYDTFESNLTQRLSSLSPTEDSDCLDMVFLKSFLQVLLDTQADLAPLISSHHHPPSQAQTRMMDGFLEQSIKILDVCRAIKEQISDMESSHGTLQLIVSCLTPKNGCMLHTGQVSRARTALKTILSSMKGDEEVAASVQFYPSFRFRSNPSGPDVPQRWQSWHGSGHLTEDANTHALQSSRQLQVLGLALTSPKLPAGDVEGNLCAAIYALYVVSIFFLGTLSASLPSLTKTYVASLATHPRSFPWASPLTHLQEKVQSELKIRGKKSTSYAGMWELDQVATILKRLRDLMVGEDDILGEKSREEIKHLVRQLQRHVEEIDRNLGPLYTQLQDFYNRIISLRIEILDMVCKLNS